MAGMTRVNFGATQIWAPRRLPCGQCDQGRHFRHNLPQWGMNNLEAIAFQWTSSILIKISFPRGTHLWPAWRLKISSFYFSKWCVFVRGGINHILIPCVQLVSVERYGRCYFYSSRWPQMRSPQKADCNWYAGRPLKCSCHQVIQFLVGAEMSTTVVLFARQSRLCPYLGCAQPHALFSRHIS